MSASRVMAPTASLVWSVANTRWPVSDACMAMRAVSRSRTSPTRMMSGAWREAATGERDRHAVEVEQPQDDLLAVERRHRRHAKIERASLSHQTDAAVVGQAMLGDVEVRHDLDARDDGGAIADGDDGGLLEQAVDAKAHHHAFGARLEMNVAGAAGEGLVQDRIDDFGDAA